MTDLGTLNDQYLEWLYGKVASLRNRNPEKNYWSLLRLLFKARFTRGVGNDDNRWRDGIDLRDEFIIDCNIEDVDPFWMQEDCSMLEMMIAFARRASYSSYGEPFEWFWRFLRNLELHEMNDKEFTSRCERMVQEAVDRINNRNYDRNGVGGLFPLRGRCDDQRKVELWHQMHAYLLENEDNNVLA